MGRSTKGFIFLLQSRLCCWFAIPPFLPSLTTAFPSQLGAIRHLIHPSLPFLHLDHKPFGRDRYPQPAPGDAACFPSLFSISMECFLHGSLPSLKYPLTPAGAVMPVSDAACLHPWGRCPQLLRGRDVLPRRSSPAWDLPQDILEQWQEEGQHRGNSPSPMGHLQKAVPWFGARCARYGNRGNYFAGGLCP